MSTPAADALQHRVQARMDALGLNPFSTAKRAGLKPGYVHDILRGKTKNPGAAKLRSLALALETSSAWLLGHEERPVEVFDQEGRLVQPAMGRSTPDGRTVKAVMLPIKFELAADVWRTATEVTDQPLGFEAATIPPTLEGREHWLEYLRDDTMRAVLPRGSLVHVVDITDEEISNLKDGDLVVIIKRIFVGDPEMHLVERSLRRITHTLPGLGLWFFSLATGDADQDHTDEVFRDGGVSDRRPSAATATPPPAESLSPEIADALNRVNASLEDKRRIKRILEEVADRRPRIVGRVVRGIVSLSPEAGFGLSS